MLCFFVAEADQQEEYDALWMLERKARSIGQEDQKSLPFPNEVYPPSKVHDTLVPSNYPVTQAQVYSDSYASIMRTSSHYICTDCGKKYKWLDSLKRHQRVDCGNKEKKFSCHVCDRKFKYRYELRNHISAHHRGWISFPKRDLCEQVDELRERDLTWISSRGDAQNICDWDWNQLKLMSYRHDRDRFFEKWNSLRNIHFLCCIIQVL